MTREPEQIWREIRWSESALRFEGDIILALLELLGKSSHQGAYSNGPIAIGPKPGPPCNPPAPCMIPIDTAKQAFEEHRQLIDRAIGHAIELLEMAADRQIKTIVVRPSQDLGDFPNGPEVGRGGTTAGAGERSPGEGQPARPR